MSALQRAESAHDLSSGEGAIEVMPSEHGGPGAGRSTDAGRPLIVVAQDRAEDRTVVGSMLGSHGFDVVLATDGVAALEAVLAHGPDAVVSDLDMANLDGLGLCRALRALRANQTLPIVVYSADDGADSRLRDARALHAAQVIGKPAAAIELAHALRRMITRAWGSVAV